VKQIAALLFVVMLIGTAGCSPEESAEEQAEVNRELSKAQADIVQATQDYISRPSTDATRFTGTLAEYQQDKYDQAEKQLESVISRGTPAQQAAAAIALAEVRAAQARYAARLALDGRVRNVNPDTGQVNVDEPYVSVGWANIATLTDETMNTLMAARRAQANAQALSTVDHTPALTRAQQHLSQLQDQRAQLTSRLNDRQREVQQFQSEQSKLQQQRQTRRNKAEDLRGRSFSATGQARFDLYTEAADITRQADNLSMRLEKIETELVKLKSQIGVLEAERAKIDQQIAATESVISNVGDQGQDHRTKADKFAQEAAKYADELVRQLKQSNKEYSNQVMARHDEAMTRMNGAVEVLSSALNKAPSHLQDRLSLERAIKQAELAHVARQAALMDASHARFLGAVVEQVDRGFPEAQADAIKTQADAAQARAEESRTQAGTALTTAAEQLASAEGAATDTKVKRAVLTQIIAVNEALAEQTDEVQYQTAADDARQQRNELAAE